MIEPKEYNKPIILRNHLKNGQKCFVDYDHPLAYKQYGIVLYSRHVLSVSLNRWISKKEKIRYIDGDKTNSDIKNIVLIDNKKEIETRFCNFCNATYLCTVSSARKYCCHNCVYQHRLKVNQPHLVVDYFKNIDSKEKAYWLGFIFADGNVHENKTINLLQFQIQLANKDNQQIDRLIEAIGFNPKKKSINIGVRKQVGFIIRNKVFINYLIKKGCIPRKSKILRFPKLNSYTYRKIFLLGYCDGNASTNRTSAGNACGSTITSGSLNFLKDVKCLFDISSSILKIAGNKRYSKSIAYRLRLPSALYKEMLSLYEFSMPRKR